VRVAAFHSAKTEGRILELGETELLIVDAHKLVVLDTGDHEGGQICSLHIKYFGIKNEMPILSLHKCRPRKCQKQPKSETSKGKQVFLAYLPRLTNDMMRLTVDLGTSYKLTKKY
jgi:hypothetical protein